MNSKLLGLVLIGWGVLTAGTGNAADPVDPEELRPGLIATHSDLAGLTPNSVTLLEPTIALNLKAGESTHPRLSAAGITIRWKGYLNVLRKGTYRFKARLRGTFVLRLGGKEVMRADSRAAEPALVGGPEVELPGEVLALEAEFTRHPGDARLEIFWSGPGFHREPLPHSVLGHLPPEKPDALREHARQEYGRFLAEEHNCLSCHRPGADHLMAKTLVDRPAPDLSRIGERAFPGWIDRWLADPQKLQPHATMPKLFADDERGRAERYAVASYLASLGGPLRPERERENRKEYAASALRGETLFATVGCAACHRQDGGKPEPNEEAASLYGLLDPTGPKSNYPLGAVGSKTRPDRLAAYLADPVAVHPSGRMPSLNLSGREARDLARHLCRQRDDAIPTDLPPAPPAAAIGPIWESLDPGADERAAFAELPEPDRWKRLGRRLVTAKGCVNCHRIAPDGQELPQREDVASSLDKLLRPESHRRGCLAPSEKEAGKAPWFGFDQTERDGLAAFLRRGLEGAGSPAPAYHARLALKRFNCLNCHQRDGEGGLSAELVETMRRYQNAGAEEMITPPPLTGVGHKLRTPWLKQVLTQSGRARPWMGLRMPQYGEANVGTLDRGLTVLEGAEPDAGVHQVALTAAKIEAGRTLIGKNGFGCISCHDIAGIANTGTRGPELSTVNQRVRYEWFRRWLEQPQRMDPGTRMPQVFAGGRSLYPALLDGDADAQAEAMWAYLSLGPSLPLPFGLEPPPGLVIQVGERPEILRTFMPNGAGDRAVAVGYPGGVSAAFDAQQCRLAYAWAGNFLDASPVWANRGGAPAKLLGPVFWTSPPGNPWGSGKEPPDFATRAKDPAYGAALPDGQLYQGPMRVRFAGYTLDAAGLPTFRYRVEDGDGSALTIAETPRPAKSTVATGVLREFKLQGPASEPAWLLAGETGGAPTLFDGAGKPVELSLKQAPVEIPAEGNLLVLPAAGGQAQALTATAAPTGTRWVLRPRPGGGWLALLKLPPANGERTLSVVIWAVARPEPGLLRGLVEAKE